MRNVLYSVFALSFLFIHTLSAQEQLEVEGAVTIGDSEVDSTAAPGTVRYNPRTEDFEGFDGRKWKSLTKANGSQWGVVPSTAALPNQIFTPEDTSSFSQFGGSVALSEEYAVVGSSGNDSVFNGAGAVFVYQIIDEDWQLLQLLFAGDADVGDRFGSSVDIDGDYIVVGATGNEDNGDDSGSAYIFVRSGQTWTQQAKLTAPDGEENDNFGSSVSISGEYAVIGAPGDQDAGDFTGSTYIFRRSGTFWSGQTKLLSPSIDSFEYFGFDVNIDGANVVVGAPGNDSLGTLAGAAYVYELVGVSWNFMQRLNSTQTDSNDFFGYAVSINEGHQVSVGAPLADGAAIDSIGRVHMFELNTDTWEETAILESENPTSSYLFGFSVRMMDDYIVVGEPDAILNGFERSGLAHIFHESNGDWEQQTCFTSGDNMTQNDQFGGAVSIFDDYVLIAASSKTLNAFQGAGVVYFFKRN